MIIKVEISFPPQLEFKLYHISRTEQGRRKVERGAGRGKRKNTQASKARSREKTSFQTPVRLPARKPCTAWPLSGLGWVSDFHSYSLSQTLS